MRLYCLGPVFFLCAIAAWGQSNQNAEAQARKDAIEIAKCQSMTEEAQRITCFNQLKEKR